MNARARRGVVPVHEGTVLRRSRIASLCLFVALSGLFGERAASASIAQRARRVERLLLQWRIGEAQAALVQLEKDEPDHPRVQLTRAQVAFHLGRYELAQRLLDELIARNGGLAASLTELAELYRSTRATVSGYVEHPSANGHFRMLVPPGKDELLVPLAGETLEAAREQLQRDLGYAPSDPIRVEVYPRPEDLARVSALSEADISRTGTIALCKYNRIMIVSPRALLRGYSWRDTLAHEYVHLVVSRVSHNRVPIWLHEGLAKHLEARWRLQQGQQPPLSPTQRHLLADALARARLVPWKQMHPSMARLPDQETTALAFAQVQTALGFISQSSPGRLRELVESIGQGQSTWGAVQEVTGLSREAFERGWKRYLRQQRFQKLPGLEPQQLRFAAKTSKEDEITAIAQRKARKLFRLADMLRQRQLVRAAVVEYEKAAELAGPREGFVANALARAYLELQQPTHAVRALLPVIEYYPELPGPQTTLGLAYLALDDKPAAVEHLEVSLRLNPFAPELHCGLAQALPSGARKVRHEQLCAELR